MLRLALRDLFQSWPRADLLLIHQTGVTYRHPWTSPALAGSGSPHWSTDSWRRCANCTAQTPKSLTAQGGFSRSGGTAL